MRPLEGVRILDFSTLLPGPMCTLLLAEAGAEVIKVERPSGDDMRGYQPKLDDDDSVNFGLLNRGKKSITADLKSQQVLERIRRLIADCDVIVEQFRPGVMDRLGLGFEAACELNPRIVYCSITGFGQDGPDAQTAAHDLNYQARTGMLALGCDDGGAPVVPPTLTADIAAGAYPAVINILLALRQRDLDGKPTHLDVSMSDNLFTLMYWALGNGFAHGRWPRAGAELVTGGSARYRIYRTADGRYLAAAPLEDRFWSEFVRLIGLPELAAADPMQDVRAQVAARIAEQPLAYWQQRLAGHDVCVSEVVSLEQAVQDPQFIHRGLFGRTASTRSGASTIALPTPVDRRFRSAESDAASPALGQHNAEILGR